MPFGGLGGLADLAWLAASSTALNVQSIAVLSSGTVIRVDYGVALDASSDPAAGDYTLSNTIATIVSANATSTYVDLTLGIPLTEDETTAQLSYTPGVNPVRNAAATVNASAFSNQLITHTSPAILTQEISRTLVSDTWFSPNRAGTAVHECVGAGAGAIIDTRAGGGGAYARGTVAYAANTGYARVPGTAGTAGGGAGGNSTFDTTAVVAEGGGQTGTASDGGRASASTGDVKYDGGAGGVGTGNQIGGASAGSGGAAAANGVPGEPDGNCGMNNSASTKIPGAGSRSTATTGIAGTAGRVRSTWREVSSYVFPDHRDVSYGRSSAADTTNHSFTLPALAQVGDLLLLFVVSDGNPTFTFNDASLAANVLATQTNAAAVTGTVTYKTMTGSDTLTFTTSAAERIQWACVAIRNAGTPTATGANGDSVSANSPNHTIASLAACRWYSFIGLDGAASAGTITASPINYDGLGTLGQQSNASCVSSSLLWRKLIAVSEDPGAFTNLTGPWVAFTVAVPSPTALIDVEQAFTTFVSSGTLTEQAPNWPIIFDGFGAGGGGARPTGDVGQNASGGGGEFSRVTKSTALSSYTISLGTGGTAGTDAGATDGGDTTVSDIAGVFLRAKGGLKGVAANPTGTAGAGGTGGVGDLRRAGGAGAVGAANSNGAGGATSGSSTAASTSIAGEPDGSSGFNGAQTSNFGAGGARRSNAVAQNGGTGLVRAFYARPVTPSAAPYIPYGGLSQWRDAANATSRVLTVPGTHVSGDRLLVLAGIDGAGALSSMTGLNELVDAADSGGNAALAVYTLDATGSDTLTLATASEQSVGVVLRIRNAAAVANWDLTGAQLNSAAALDAPSHTHAGGSKSILWIAVAIWDGNTPERITATPTGWDRTLYYPPRAYGSATPGIVVAMKTQTIATLDPPAWTGNSTRIGYAATIAIPIL